MFSKKVLGLFLFYSVLSLSYGASGENPIAAKSQGTENKENEYSPATHKVAKKDKNKNSDSLNSNSKNESSNVFFFVLESALKNNKDILSAQRELMAAHEDYVTSSAAFKPNISMNTNYQAGKSDAWNSGASSDSDSLKSSSSMTSAKSYGVDVVQNIFNGMADTAALKETNLNIKAQWSSYEALKQKILKDVAKIYFDILAKKQEVKHLESLLESRQSSVNVIEEMHATGAAKYLEVAQAKAAYDETQAKLDQAKADYEGVCAQFEDVTGIKVPENIALPLKLFDTNLLKTQAIDIALTNNPSIIAATSKLDAAKEAVKKPNARLSPSVDLKYSFNQSLDNGHKDSPSFANQRGHTITVGMKIPVYDGGIGRAEKRKSQEIATKAAVERDKVIANVKSQIVTVLAKIEAAKQSMISTKNAVKFRELALHDTNEEYKAGVKIASDVLDAQEKLCESNFASVHAENQYFTSQCEAIELLGRLTLKHLKIKDSEFNYKKHFTKTKARL